MNSDTVVAVFALVGVIVGFGLALFVMWMNDR